MKRLLIAALVSVLPLVACKTKEGAGGKEAPKTTTTTPPPKDPPKEAPEPATGDDMAKRYVECWGFYNAKDWKNFETCYAPGATSELVNTYGVPDATGYAKILEHHTKPFVDAFPDAKGDVELTLINGKDGVTVALFTGTHTGLMKSPMGDVPATSKKFGFRVAHAVHFVEDGKAVDKQKFYVDNGTLMSQLGLSPAPARPVADKANPNEIVVAKDDETETKNQESLTKILDAFNKHDLKGLDALVADDLVWSEIGMPKDWNKKESIESHEALFKAFSDLKITPTTTWAAGDYVVQQGTFAGTNDGDSPKMGIKKSGKKMSLNFLQVYKFNKDGKLAGSWGYWNGVAFAMQLGLIPPPGAPKAPAKDVKAPK